jgi:DNA invertase Pin-like site-specific DNA recombinase
MRKTTQANGTKQVIGYVRVSTADQQENGVSLDAQQARINAWATANGHNVGGVFLDAMSGKRADNRVELQKALDAVCKAGGVLVVYSLSRLARSTKDAISISERLQKAGADLVSLTENIDTTTAAGKMIFGLLAVLAQFERDQISERTTAALAYKATQGERTGQVPFGYTLDADGVKLVENAAEQRVISTITELRQQGHALREIADYLNTNGITSKTGGVWYASSVKSVIDTTSRKAAA